MAGIGWGALALTAIGFAIAFVLGRTSKRLASDDESIVDAINRQLPQTQCAQCGYPGCRPYAEAVASGEAINKCPPGGQAVMHALADLLGRQALPLAEDTSQAQSVAVIREAECIGCTLCIQACPVDAIIGATQLMHTVIAEQCTGCELCIPPCPVDCIDLVALPAQVTPVAAPAAGRFNCIRCGDCETVCPRALLPQELFWYRDNLDRLTDLDIDACIECRLCDRACPSEIPLTDIFRSARFDLAAQRVTSEKARQAEARYQRHVDRLAAQTVKVRRRPSADETRKLIASSNEQNE